MIVRKGPRKFQLLSRSTGRVLGTHPSYEAALRQERAIKASQARAARGVRNNPRIQGESHSKKVMDLVDYQIRMNDGRCPVCGRDVGNPYHRLTKSYEEGCVSLHHLGHVLGTSTSTSWYFRPDAKEIRREQANRLAKLA